MKKLGNTLFVTIDGAYISREGETVVVRADGEDKMRVPIHALAGIVTFGLVSCSPQLMALCSQNGVAITYLTNHGHFLARVEGPVSGNVLLRKAQYRISDDKQDAANVARGIVAAKVYNSRNVLLRAMRDHPEKIDNVAVSSCSNKMARCLVALRNADDLESIRGTEGEASREYFQVFDNLIVGNKESFSFTGRSRRPPMDRVNCLLSFLYTMLVHDCRAALEGVGLDSQVGFLHRDRPGRPSLALDMMEEFRACLVDRLVLSLINRNQIEKNDFETTGSGAVIMRDDARKTVLVAYQNRKQEELIHPFLNDKAPLGIFFHIQAQLLARHLRGELDAYPPFFWK